MQSREQLTDVAPEDLDEMLDRGFRFALSLTHDRSDAEDLVQDAVATMLAKGASWQRPYLFATIRNRYIDGYRRRQNLQFVSLESETESVFPDASRTFEPVDTLESAQLHGALGALRTDERETLFLAVVEGYTAEEIARITSRPRGTVLSLLFRAKRKLRDTLTAARRTPRRAAISVASPA